MWNAPKKVWEYVAKNYFHSRPTPPASSSIASSATSTLPSGSSMPVSITTPVSGSVNPDHRSTTTSALSGIPTADISISICILQKTIIETICQGGSVVFETKTYGGEFTQSYMVRPTYAPHVEVQIAAWPNVPIGDYYSGGASGCSGSSGSSGSVSRQCKWYFDESGNRHLGQDSNGYDFVVIEE